MSRKNFSPFPVLTTARLTLRQLTSVDEQAIFDLRSNDSVNKYLDRQPCKSFEDARRFIEIVNENIESGQSVYWAITLNGSNNLIGTICLFDFSGDGTKAELGYELLPASQGKGIMKEAAASVIQFGFQQVGLQSMVAYTHPEIETLPKNYKRHLRQKDTFSM